MIRFSESETSYEGTFRELREVFLFLLFTTELGKGKVWERGFNQGGKYLEKRGENSPR
jgi:hypothetical protein